MKKLTRGTDKRTKIEIEIDSILDEMAAVDPQDDRYRVLLQRLNWLMEAKSKEKSKIKISPDTIAVGVFGLIQLGLVLHHEKLNVITSKAFNWILRGRV